MYGSAFSADAEDSAGYGWQVDVQGQTGQPSSARRMPNWTGRRDSHKSLLANAGAELIEGAPPLLAHIVLMNGKTITAERILVATGGWPQIPDVPGLRACDHVKRSAGPACMS